MDLDQLLLLPKWTPLSAIVGSIEHDQFIEDGLYRFSNNIYLGASEWCGPNFDTGPDGPFVTEAIWAVDHGALRRATQFDIDADSGTVADVPRAFLPANAGAQYRSILDALRQRESNVCLESASYRIARDGHFMYRSIQNAVFQYFFRSNKADDDEQPFAAARNLVQR